MVMLPSCQRLNEKSRTCPYLSLQPFPVFSAPLSGGFNTSETSANTAPLKFPPSPILETRFASSASNVSGSFSDHIARTLFSFSGSGCSDWLLWLVVAFFFLPMVRDDWRAEAHKKRSRGPRQRRDGKPRELSCSGPGVWSHLSHYISHTKSHQFPNAKS